MARNIGAENRAREARFQRRGWKSYGQYRYWHPRLTANDRALTRQLAVQIGGEVEPNRAGSLMSTDANNIVNPQGVTRSPHDWEVRLLVAAGKIKEAAA